MLPTITRLLDWLGLVAPGFFIHKNPSNSLRPSRFREATSLDEILVAINLTRDVGVKGDMEGLLI